MRVITLKVAVQVLILCATLVSNWLAASDRSRSQSPIPTKSTMQKLQMPKHSREVIVGDAEPQFAVIWLHGLGATADDFPPIVPELGLDKNLAVRFVFPQAPQRPITINGGFVMPGWYDIKGLSIEDKQDAEGMAQSRDLIENIIQQLVDTGISSDKIVLAGFSQGGAVTYFTGVRSKQKLAGLLTLSTYLPFDADTADELSETNKAIPIFASHGTFDPVVPIAMGEHSITVLKNLGYQIEWQTYPMEHEVSMRQIRDIGVWLNGVFADPQ